MEKHNKILRIVSASFFWFLVLPFPFENQSLYQAGLALHWIWMGGYHLLTVQFNAVFPTGDFAIREENSSRYSYSHHWYFFAFVFVSLALGYLTYLAILKLGTNKKDPSAK